jgi:hypothetical protein
MIDIDRTAPCRDRTTITARAGIMSTREIPTEPVDRDGATRRDDTDRLGRVQFCSGFRLLGGPLDPHGLIDASGQTAMVLGASARLISQPGYSQSTEAELSDGD